MNVFLTISRLNPWTQLDRSFEIFCGIRKQARLVSVPHCDFLVFCLYPKCNCCVHDRWLARRISARTLRSCWAPERTVLRCGFRSWSYADLCQSHWTAKMLSIIPLAAGYCHTGKLTSLSQLACDWDRRTLCWCCAAWRSATTVGRSDSWRSVWSSGTAPTPVYPVPDGLQKFTHANNAKNNRKAAHAKIENEGTQTDKNTATLFVSVGPMCSLNQLSE